MSNNISYYLEMANLQIATEAFWDGWDPVTNRDTSTWTDQSLTQNETDIKKILTTGNFHSSLMTQTQADEFYVNYEVVAHQQNTAVV